MTRLLSAGALAACASIACSDTSTPLSDAAGGKASVGREPPSSAAGEPGNGASTADGGEGGGAAQPGGAGTTTHEGGRGGVTIFEPDAGAGWASDEGSVGFPDATAVECANDEKALGPALYSSEFGANGTRFEDLNHDGRDDWLALVSGSVSVRLGMADGGWGAPTHCAVGPTPRQLVLIDVNLDGVMDLVVDNGYDASLSLLLGGPGGTFGPAKTFAVPGIVQSLVVAKLNADEYPDLGLTTVNDMVVALINTGFERFELGFTETLEGANGIAALDVDADGASDLVVAASPAGDERHAVHAFVNQGKGAFSRGGTAFPDAFPLLLAADLNDDGSQDLLVADGVDPKVSVLLSKKLGGFSGPQRHRLPAPPIALSTLDADGDGELDVAIAVGGWTSGVVVLRNQGRGALGAATTYSVGGLPSQLSVADLNADGSPDLMVTHRDLDAATPLLNRGTGQFAAPVTYPTDEDASDGIALDLNGDGYADLARLSQSGGLGISLNLGDGTFGPPREYSTGAITNAVIAIDSDHDQNLDVAVAGADGILVFGGHGDATLESSVAYAPGTVVYSLAAGDLDDDGYQDLAFTGGDDASVAAVFGRAEGGFGEPVLYPGPGAATPWRLVAGDYDGDGKLDLASISLAGSKLAVLLNQGQRSFAPPVEYDTGEGPQQLVSADLDQDGHLDIAVVSRSELNIFINQTDGTFATTRYPVGPNSAYLVGGDFDGSGAVSFLVFDLTKVTWTLHLNDGRGTFFASRRFGGVRGIIAADLDRDGATDVVSCIATGYAVMMSSCPGVTEPQWLPTKMP